MTSYIKIVSEIAKSRTKKGKDPLKNLFFPAPPNKWISEIQISWIRRSTYKYQKYKSVELGDQLPQNATDKCSKAIWGKVGWNGIGSRNAIRIRCWRWNTFCLIPLPEIFLKDSNIVDWFVERHLSRIVLDFSLWVGIVLVICPQFFPSNVMYQGLLPIVLDHKIFLS